MLSAGIFLESSESLEDPNFQKAVLFITAHNAAGATGFVINKLFHRTLNELEEFKNSSSFPLYEGGPVETDKLYFLHRRPDLIEEGIKINNSIYLGGNFQQALACINDGSIGSNDIKIFIGYCGWDPLQLEEEIEEGSWLIKNQNSQSIFIV